MRNENTGMFEDDEEELSSEEEEEETTWIQWFCSLKGNEFFTEVDESFIEDSFNLYGLRAQVPYYDYALDMILDTEPEDDSLSVEQQEKVESSAETLYGLIHARYILTGPGMMSMYDKYKACHFGRCPRVMCYGQPVLPVGQSDIPGTCKVKVFCPLCNDVYNPRSTLTLQIDGAFFGTTFPHLFLLCHNDLAPKITKAPQIYEPRIYGFKIYRPGQAPVRSLTAGDASSSSAPGTTAAENAGRDPQGSRSAKPGAADERPAAPGAAPPAAS